MYRLRNPGAWPNGLECRCSVADHVEIAQLDVVEDRDGRGGGFWAGIARQNSHPAYRSVVSGRWIRPPPRRCYARAKVIWSVVSARRSFDSEASALASRLAERPMTRHSAESNQYSGGGI